jgi:hypothetical protein
VPSIFDHFLETRSGDEAAVRPGILGAYGLIIRIE